MSHWVRPLVSDALRRLVALALVWLATALVCGAVVWMVMSR